MNLKYYSYDFETLLFFTNKLLNIKRIYKNIILKWKNSLKSKNYLKI